MPAANLIFNIYLITLCRIPEDMKNKPKCLKLKKSISVNIYRLRKRTLTMIFFKINCIK